MTPMLTPTVRHGSLFMSLLLHRGFHEPDRDHRHSVLRLPFPRVGSWCGLCLQDVWPQAWCVCVCVKDKFTIYHFHYIIHNLEYPYISTSDLFFRSCLHYCDKVSFIPMDLRKFIVSVIKTNLINHVCTFSCQFWSTSFVGTLVLSGDKQVQADLLCRLWLCPESGIQAVTTAHKPQWF